MQTLTWIMQMSRPRFWFYLFGPFLIGIATIPLDSLKQFVPELVLLGLFFLLPANLLIYGVNDLFDYETDKHNPKKKSYETLLEPKNRSKFISILAAIIVPFLAVFAWLLFDSGSFNTTAFVAMGCFLFFGVGYSVPPIRAKTKPFLDSFFNILYIFPGMVSFAVITQSWPTVDIILAATLWCMAMHAFSAIPDIQADKKAKLQTIATKLGRNGTLLFCYACYIAAASLTAIYIGKLSFITGVVYGAMMYLAYKSRSDKELFAVYKAFPYVNVVLGFALFWYLHLFY